MRFSSLRCALLAGGVVLGLLSSCRDDRDPVPPPGPETAGREYFPLAVGQYWEYDVEEHYWNYNVDSVAHLQFRERVDTAFVGATGEVNYRIVRSRRTDSLSVWRDDSSVAVVLTTDLVRRTAANVPTLELLFPVREGKTWNPNLFNSADSTVRQYAQVGNTLSLTTGRSFTRTLRVVDEPQLSAVARREHEAAYAWGVGCVYRRRQVLDYCNQSDVNEGRCQLGTGYIVRGFEREEQLRKWGVR